jgi:hypothetical protein
MAKKDNAQPATWMRLEVQAKRLHKAAKDMDKAIVGLAMAQLVVLCHELEIKVEGIPHPRPQKTSYTDDPTAGYGPED